MSPNDPAPGTVPLERWAELVAEHAAQRAIEKHIDLCPLPRKVAENEVRIRKLELSRATLLGMMIGSGVIGGSVAKLLAGLI